MINQIKFSIILVSFLLISCSESINSSWISSLIILIFNECDLDIAETISHSNLYLTFLYTIDDFFNSLIDLFSDKLFNQLVIKKILFLKI